MFEPALPSEMAEALPAESSPVHDVPVEALDAIDRYGGVALGVECAWPLEAIT